MRSQGRLALGAVGALAVVAAVVPTAAPAAAATSLDARMRASAAFPRVHGLAEYYVGSGDFEMVIHHVQGLAGKRVTVRVHGAFVGRALVRSNGSAWLDRHRGVPAMHAGNVVRVRAPGGSLVSRGTLRPD